MRQQDLEALKQSHPHLRLPGLAVQRDARRDLHARPIRPPSTMCACGAPSPMPSIARRSLKRSGAGAHRPRHSPRPGRVVPAHRPARCGGEVLSVRSKGGQAPAGGSRVSQGLKTQLTVTSGFGRDLVDDAQLAQRYLKDVGIEAELKLQEYGAYMATTFTGQVRGPGAGPLRHCLGTGCPAVSHVCHRSARNSRHVNDPKITAMLKEQRRTKDLEARKQNHLRHPALCGGAAVLRVSYCVMITGSWQPYVKNYGPNLSFDYGNRAAALWLER